MSKTISKTGHIDYRCSIVLTMDLCGSLVDYLAKEARRTRTWKTSMKPTNETTEGQQWGFRGFYKRVDPSIYIWRAAGPAPLGYGTLSTVYCLSHSRVERVQPLSIYIALGHACFPGPVPFGLLGKIVNK